MERNNQSLTISITVDDAAAALEYYQKAFNAEVVSKFEMPGGILAHADMKIGNTLFYLSGEYPEWKAFSPNTVGGCPNLLCLNEEDCDELFKQALEVGGEVMMPMADQPWGTRSGVLVDPFGYRWNVGKTVEVLTNEQIMERLTQMPSE